ncbi:Tn3 family transposase [Microbispora sp. H10830]|uniref:Tn3 family transposase n=1 Tax=Microbispora sp. H10830 TaxID=2729109 RepID=UPI0015FF16C8|nr:Tn3 family transposase [Microbispora sp. H10830]
MTWLNAVNDQGIGRGAKVISGTIRGSLHMVDVIFGLDGGELPEIVVTDTGSYSDVVFGPLELLGISYRPALADLPDQKGWRINTDETYRRDIKHIRNLQEGRHALARKICHGKKGELYHRYERGLENQLGVLGLVLNCVVLWTTVYLDAAVRQLKAQGCPVRDEDMARLSPFVNRHLGVHGAYSFVLPELAPGIIRDLRDPDAAEDDDL